MKRLSLLLAVFLLAAFSSCSQVKRGDVLLSDGAVSQVEVSSLPEGYHYSFSGKAAETVREYISALHLKAHFKESPELYGGMTWVIRLVYEDGNEQTIYHFGNMFIREESGRWFRMEYEEAAAFESLLGKHSD